MQPRVTWIPIVLLIIAAVLLIPRSTTAGAVAEPLLRAPPALGAGAQHYDLGNGRYLAIIPAAPGLAETYDQQPYIDTYVDSATPKSAYCTNAKLAVGYFSDEFGIHRQRTMIGFHLSSIPANAVVTSARFYAYLFAATGQSSVAVYVRRVTTGWDCPLYWDALPSSTGYTSQSVSSKPGWRNWNVTSVVQNYWLGRNFGVSPNFGLQLRGSETGGSLNYFTRHFRSKNASSNRPHLVVEYAFPTPTRTATRTPTRTAIPSKTPTHTLTRVPTRTAIPSKTPTRTATATAMPSLTASPTTAICPDIYEPNDTFATAYDLDPVDPAGYYAYVCSPSDEDHYSFNVPRDDEITVKLLELPANYDLELWDPHEHMVGESRNGGQEPEGIVFVARDLEGEYRVRVLGAAGAYSTEKAYHLTVSMTTTIPSALIVNTTDDVDDGTCDAVHCSLREAIHAANASDAWQIYFDIPSSMADIDRPVWTIQPASPLPAITQVVDLDGSTQTTNQGNTNLAGPEIVLDGSLLTGADGLVVDGTMGSTIRELIVCNFDGAGVRFEGGSQNTLQGCYVGTDHTGATAAGNQTGILVSGGGYHSIGGTSSVKTWRGNLISANLSHGLHLSGTHDIYVKANRIGTDITGSADLGNTADGIHLSDGAQQNVIGGDRDTEGNVISGNDSNGIEVEGADSTRNEILGNYIGVNDSATAAVHNSYNGIRISEGGHNTIGSASVAGQSNVIGGNLCLGSSAGIRLSNSSRNTVAGNYIGTNPIGTRDLGNEGPGVLIFGGSQANTIGPHNDIANNGDTGVTVTGRETLYNTITRNHITNNDEEGIKNDSGGNQELLPPVIVAATTTSVQGTACARCRVEVFADPAGEGEIYEDAVTANMSGEWTWLGSPSLGPDRVTATATDADGNTSQFSSCRDAYEPNDSFADAIAIDAGEEIESYLCHSDDVDYFRVPIPPHSVMTVELFSPPQREYQVALYQPDQTLIDEVSAVNPHTGTLEHSTVAGGDFFVRVRTDTSYSASWPYTLRVTVGSLPTDVSMWLDEGWLGDTQVYKLIPDADGPADTTLVDVVLDITADTTERTVTAYVYLTIPGDAFGPPIGTYFRYCTGCSSGETIWLDEGAGRYMSSVNLLPVHRTLPHGQLIFRFGIPPGAVPGVVIPAAQLSYERDGPVMGSAGALAIALVTDVPAIVVTSRQHLYLTHYNRADAVQLLGEVTQAAQGPASGVAGAMLAAIYYVDDYSTEARDWDNATANYSGEAAANVAVYEIDDLIEDWAEDAGGAPYLLILGDDDVIPLFRRSDPCDGDDTESAHLDSGGDPVLDRVIAGDFVLTDNWYADTNNSGAHRGELELNVGRIIGDTASDLLGLFQGGLSGPSVPALSPRALMASWDHQDLHYGSASYASVLEHAQDWGFAVNDDLVDNEDWDKADFLQEAQNGYSVMITGNHGNPWNSTAPEYDGIAGWEVAAAISTTAPTRLPFYGFGDCRIGSTLVTGGFIDWLIPQGASGFVGSYGITWGMPAGSENYTEEVHNNFWRRALNDSGTERPVGQVLRSAKADYSAGWRWSCRDLKGVIQLNLYGVPWMAIPAIGGAGGSASAAGESGQRAPAFSHPAGMLDSHYAVTATVEASSYQITEAPFGFQLVEVEGFEQHWLDGPLMPWRELTFPIPAGADVTGVTADFGGQVDLGTLNLPWYVRKVAISPGLPPHQWLEIPPETGVIPAEPYAYEVREAGGHQVVHLHVIPLSYDPASNQATLYQQVSLRVDYTSPVPVAVTDLYLDAAQHAPGRTVTALAEVVNVSDQTAVLSATLRLTGMYGHEVGVTHRGPFTVEAGESQVIAPSCPAPAEEGAYDLRLTLWHNGMVVAEARQPVQVVAVQIAAFEGPEQVVPGETAAFTVTLANFTAQALQAEFVLDIATEWGQPVASLAPQTKAVPAGGQATVGFAWDSVAPAGRYQAVASVQPGGYSSRSRTQLLRLMGEHQVYLPAILKKYQR
jgi:CSLREA domain-containing protein